VFDGRGTDFSAEIVSIDRRRVVIQLGEIQTNDAESPLTIELGQVISRGDRMDYAVQKAAELGACCLTPLLSERCEVKLDQQRQAKRRQHWQQIAISASEQCGRPVIAKINPITALDEWLHGPDNILKLVFHPAKNFQISAINLSNGVDELPEPGQPPENIAILIGPEGGLSDREVDNCTARGFIPITLGPRILRTETAPVVALTWLQLRWGDFSMA